MGLRLRLKMGGKAKSDTSILKRLILEARTYWPHLLLLLFLDFLATPLALLTPLPLKLAVDNVLGSEPLPGFLAAILPSAIQQSQQLLLIFSAGLLVVVAVLVQFQSLAYSYWSVSTGGIITLGFRSRLFWHGQRLSLAYHDSKGVSHALYRVQYDAPAIQWLAIDGLIPLIAAFVTLISMIFVISVINLQLAMIALIVIPVLIYLIKSYRMPLRKGWKKQKQLDNQAMSVITEVFSSLRVVKAFTQEEREKARYADQAGESLTAQLKITLLQGSFNLLTGMVTALGTGIVLFFGAEAIQAGTMTIGDLLIVMSYLTLLYGPLKLIGNTLAGMQNVIASAERAFEFLDQESDVPECGDAMPLQRALGSFILTDVSFGYEEGNPVLNNIALDIPTGSRVGIAGKTGAGKSTFLSLLMRFYDPISGDIFLDGVNLKNLKLHDLRKQFGIVLQEPVLFSNSIADNIAYGCPSASEEEIISAAKAANAHEFIKELPDKYDTLVGERGMRLSGGERQRVALARAFLRDAPILLLDEPTSSVDVKTEELIMQAMDRLMKGRTTFMIAHRLSTLEDCDLLLEVKEGRVVQVENKLGQVSS
ncbi:ABC transporter ATP-binding protein [Pseudomonadota bacterium]